MAKRRRSRSTGGKSKPTKSKLPRAAEVVGFTELDEAFFAAGVELDSAEPQPAESFDDLEAEPVTRPSFWRRLFSRARNRATLAA